MFNVYRIVVNLVGMKSCETYAAVSHDMVVCVEQVMIETSLCGCVGNDSLLYCLLNLLQVFGRVKGDAQHVLWLFWIVMSSEHV